MLEPRRLRNQSLLIERNYVNGVWVNAVSGQNFEVHGMHAARDCKLLPRLD